MFNQQSINLVFTMVAAAMAGGCAAQGPKEENVARTPPFVDTLVAKAASGVCVDPQPQEKLRKALSAMEAYDLATLAHKGIVVCLSPLNGQQVTFMSRELRGIYSPSTNVVSINYGDNHFLFKTHPTLAKLADALRSGKEGTLVTYGINQGSLGPGGNVWMTLGAWGQHQVGSNRNFINRYTKQGM